MRASNVRLALLAAISLATCAGARPAPLISYESMNKEQRLQAMKSVITPKLNQVFSDYDDNKYAEFGCKTCHGEKTEDTKVFLPVLKLSGDGRKKLEAQKPALMKFMAGKVVPAMAAALGQKQGYSCAGCHKVE